MQDPLPEVLRPAAAAVYLSVCQSQFFKLATRPDFPQKIRLGGRATGYRRKDIDDWLETRKVAK